MRRLIAALVSRRQSAAGAPLAWDALREAGWPGDRSSAASAKNRVHAMVSRLRDEGLRAVLLTSDQGYWLDPRYELVVDG